METAPAQETTTPTPPEPETATPISALAKEIQEATQAAVRNAIVEYFRALPANRSVGQPVPRTLLA